MPKIRKTLILLCLLLIVGSVAVSSDAAPLRSAEKGDRIGKLTAGLKGLNSDVGKIACPQGTIYGVWTYWMVPGTQALEDEDVTQALVVTWQVAGRDRVALTFDKDDPSIPVMWYAVDGNGTIQYLQAYKENVDLNVSETCKALSDIKP